MTPSLSSTTSSLSSTTSSLSSTTSSLSSSTSASSTTAVASDKFPFVLYNYKHSLFFKTKWRSVMKTLSTVRSDTAKTDKKMATI